VDKHQNVTWQNNKSQHRLYLTEAKSMHSECGRFVNKSGEDLEYIAMNNS
jgi:hypothetical protein